ncbi:MAG TPA: hypothetical protein VFB60_09820, partial [Ktedonobacteraceae bacterium]|nr:hypothetical protein [Ktedonobacteraceae bacterium]
FQTERLASEPFERKVLAVGAAHRQHLPLPVSAEGARSQSVQRLLRNPEQLQGFSVFVMLAGRSPARKGRCAGTSLPLLCAPNGARTPAAGVRGEDNGKALQQLLSGAFCGRLSLS